MNTKGLARKIKPPCQKCPYKLGQIEAIKNPCPECKMDGYKSYERFADMLSRGELISKEGQVTGL